MYFFRLKSKKPYLWGIVEILDALSLPKIIHLKTKIK